MEAGLGWRLGGLAADDLGMAVLVQLSPRKRRCRVGLGLDFFRVSSIGNGDWKDFE